MIAEIPELSGCIAHGNNEYDALQNLQDAKKTMDFDSFRVRGYNPGT